jgi:hypothetical protein
MVCEDLHLIYPLYDHHSLPQQRAVVRWLHSTISVRWRDKTDNLFGSFSEDKFQVMPQRHADILFLTIIGTIG